MKMMSRVSSATSASGFVPACLRKSTPSGCAGLCARTQRFFLSRLKTLRFGSGSPASLTIYLSVRRIYWIFGRLFGSNVNIYDTKLFNSFE